MIRARLLPLAAGLMLGVAACQPGGSKIAEPSLASATSACDAAAIRDLDRARVIERANGYLSAEPRTVTADIAERSAGGSNDFYSEGDYWWPVPGEPDAPYDRRDGQSNPDNFVAHRLSMIRLSDITASLASAWRVTGDERYAEAALPHLRAWFVDPDTRMNPSLLYAQAIQGRHTGRSIGLIDTLHLVEVARAAKVLGEAGAIPAEDFAAIREWFAEYVNWMNTHPYGIRERDWHNNHAIAWGLQIAAFSDLTGDEALADLVREQFKTVYLPEQMRADGGFPDELSRTKPYGYSLFVLDLMGGIAQILSTEDDDLWRFELADGRGMRRGLNFMRPYLKDKDSWPYDDDVAYHDEWPVRHTAFVFGGQALGDCGYLESVTAFPTDSDVTEVTRNFPMRYPVLWMD